MSHASANPGGILGGATGFLAGGGITGLIGSKQGSDAYTAMTTMPNPEAPPEAPKPSKATETALQAQLQNEVQMRASRTLFQQPGGGMLDQPSPASRILLGGY